MSAEWRSNLGTFLGATDRAIKSGLIAAAELYVADVKDELKHGYTSGDFVTGNNVNHVERGEPEVTSDGAKIAVGSTQTDPPYPLYWEVGFIPARGVFSPGVGSVTQGPVGMQRKEVWGPTLVNNRDKYGAAVAEEIRAVDGIL